jgi:hypothetical protein
MADIENKAEPDFKCCVCGELCYLAPDPPGKAYCCEHCPDHEYEHDSSRRAWFCVTCDREMYPEDYPTFEDDVI